MRIKWGSVTLLRRLNFLLYELTFGGSCFQGFVDKAPLGLGGTDGFFDGLKGGSTSFFEAGDGSGTFGLVL